MFSLTILLWITTISRFCNVTTSIIPSELITNKYEQISSIPKKYIRSSNALENNDDNDTGKKLSSRAVWEGSFKLLLPVNGKRSREGKAQENNEFYSSFLAKYLDLEERVLADNDNTNGDDIKNKTSDTVDDVGDKINDIASTVGDVTDKVSGTVSQTYDIL